MEMDISIPFSVSSTGKNQNNDRYTDFSLNLLSSCNDQQTSSSVV